MQVAHGGIEDYKGAGKQARFNPYAMHGGYVRFSTQDEEEVKIKK